MKRACLEKQEEEKDTVVAHRCNRNTRIVVDNILNDETKNGPGNKTQGQENEQEKARKFHFGSNFCEELGLCFLKIGLRFY